MHKGGGCTQEMRKSISGGMKTTKTLGNFFLQSQSPFLHSKFAVDFKILYELVC